MRTLGLSLVALLLLVLAGCNPPGGNGQSGPGPESDDSVIQAPTGEGKVEGKLEIVAFEGGYGVDFFRTCAEEYAAKNPGLTATVDGDPRIWDKVRPRMTSGDHPDFMFPGWGMDHWGLVQDGQLMALDNALDSVATDGKTKWRDTFDPNILKLCQKDGHTYMLPLYVMTYGWWYDPGLWAKNGWVPPKDTDELMTLCEKIKAKGIAPMAFQGQYPYYMIENLLLPWAASSGGIKTVVAAQNLDPGSWKSEAMLKAAQMVCTMRDKGYFLQGSVAMSHTESQTQFLQGKAAMVPCGSWLESEMKKSMPPGVTVRWFNCPIITGGQGDPTSMLIGVEPWMVPIKSKNPNAAVGYFKFMTSLDKAKKFVEQKGSLMSILGSDQVKLPKTLVAPAAGLKAAKTVWAVQYRSWYPAMQKEIEGAMTSMLNGELTAEQFCDRCEAAAQTARDDKDLPKYKVG